MSSKSFKVGDKVISPSGAWAGEVLDVGLPYIWVRTTQGTVACRPESLEHAPTSEPDATGYVHPLDVPDVKLRDGLNVWRGQDGRVNMLNTDDWKLRDKWDEGHPEGPLPILPTDSAARKEVPIFSGAVAYFPRALAAIAKLSFDGNRKHAKGQPLQWVRNKSADHEDALMRHIVDRLGGTHDAEGNRYRAQIAWRALAMLELELESEAGK